MEREAALGALGLVGICHETLRIIRSYPPGFDLLFVMVTKLSLCLLAHVAVSRALFSNAVAAASNTRGAGFDHLAANWAPFFLVEAAFLGNIVLESLLSAAICVFAVAARYSVFPADVERDAHSVADDLRQVPRFLSKYLVSVFNGNHHLAAGVARVTVTSCVAFPVLLGHTAIFAALAVLVQMHLPRSALLLLVGGTAYLAAAAHISAVWRVACVLSALEDGARGFLAFHRSDELLSSAGKFWAAGAVFMSLDSCAVAVQLAFGALVVDNRMGLGVLVRVAAGVALVAVLWAAVIMGLVAQVVVYLVCKSYSRRRESPDDRGEEASPISAGKDQALGTGSAQHTATA